ncbi:MAG: methylenetetrahydrofolate reductase [Pseudomonadota bacterium]
MNRPIISFEFFPPKNEAAFENLAEVAHTLKALKPSFVTVTFGAGGSTKSGTFDTARFLQDRCGLTVGAHLSYFGFRKDELFAYADQLWAAGIKHLVALRGDIPAGTDFAAYQGDDYFHYTSDFVEALLTRHPFDISVGAYPEKHPDAPSMEADLIALQKKCSAGAMRAITQFFFDTSIYAQFLKLVAEHHIKTPMVPGLLPIGDLQKIKGFAGKCGATLPDGVVAQLTGCMDSQQAAISFLSEQIKDMTALNVPHIHFYTLNRSDLIMPACVTSQLI